jgi:hypothetical protein
MIGFFLASSAFVFVEYFLPRHVKVFRPSSLNCLNAFANDKSSVSVAFFVLLSLTPEKAA